MEDRRQAPRRQGERREFRSEPGRRAPDGGGRRRRLRHYVVPLLLLAMPLGLGAAYRAEVVVPRAERARLAGEVGEQVRGVLASTSFPGLSFPGAGPALSGAPWSTPLRVPESARADFIAACSRIPEDESSYREVPALARSGALCALFLGDDWLARRRWARLAAYGVLEQAAEARVGLAILQVKLAVESEDPLDQAFALDRADSLLREAEQAMSDMPEIERNLAVVEELRTMWADESFSPDSPPPG